MTNQVDQFKRVISHAKEYGYIFQSSEQPETKAQFGRLTAKKNKNKRHKINFRAQALKKS